MMTEAPPSILPNVDAIPKGRIGRFIVERAIGQGSVGTVYLFRDPLIGRKIAIKVLKPQLPADQRQLFEKYFIQEARAAGRLNHPNIVTVYDADKSDDMLFIAMEYLDGKELRDLLATGHQFTYKQIADLVARTANALDYAHRQGVIHRDIKPANIFVLGRSTPKVLDFGIASASRQLSDHEATLGHDTFADTRLLGTPSYMSPEQARCEKVDARTDIFSLGVVLYQLLCGQLPFKGDGIKALLEAISKDPAVPPHEIRNDVPLRLARIAAKALAKKPEDRYQRASDMADDLNRFLTKERASELIAKLQPQDADAAAKNTVAAPPSSASNGRRSRMPVLIGMVSAIAVAAAAWTVWRSAPSGTAPAPMRAATSVGPMAQTKTEVPAAPAKPPETVAASVASSAINDVAAGNSAASNADADTKERAVASDLQQPVVSKPGAKPKPAHVVKPVPAVPVVGAVVIAAAPWGEVYVDGNSKGVAPPLSRLNLPIGAHRIEIRNGEDHYAVTIDVTSDKETRVSHRF